MAARKWPQGISLREEGSGDSKMWRASIGKKFDENPRRKAFKIHVDAVGWLEAEIAKHEHQQSELKEEAKRLDLTTDQVADARIALAMLAGRASLLEAATAWLEHVEPTQRVPQVSTAIQKLIRQTAAEGNSSRHVNDLEKYLNSFFRFFKSRHLNQLRKLDMQRALRVKMGPPGRKVPPSSAQQEKRHRYASILINFGVTHGWIRPEKNPLTGVNPAKGILERVGFLNFEQVARLLYTATETQPDLVPMLAVKIFSGIRNSECFQLTWGQFKSKQIEVLAAFAKTNRFRPVKIHPTLTEWLRERRGKPDELVFGLNPKTKDREACWLGYFEKVWKVALPEFEKWPQNALRHTFGSHYYALSKSISETSYEMGNSEGVVKRHYVNAVEDDDCKRFWRMIPAVAESIVDKSSPGGPSAVD